MFARTRQALWWCSSAWYATTTSAGKSSDWSTTLRGDAENEMQKIADDIRSQWPVTDIAIQHRTGRLEIGEASLLVAVSSSPRRGGIRGCERAGRPLQGNGPGLEEGSVRGGGGMGGGWPDCAWALSVGGEDADKRCLAARRPAACAVGGSRHLRADAYLRCTSTSRRTAPSPSSPVGSSTATHPGRRRQGSRESGKRLSTKTVLTAGEEVAPSRRALSANCPRPPAHAPGLFAAKRPPARYPPGSSR
jgi:hypothetical protein